MDEFTRIFHQILDFAEANSGELSPEVQQELAAFIQEGMEYIQRGNGIAPPPPPLPLGADMLWELAGSNPGAFIEYLRTVPDPALNAVARNPEQLERVIRQLSEQAPAQLPRPQEAGIEKAPYNSSNIWGFHYSPKSGHLLVRFQGGSVYAYNGVPPGVFNIFQRGAIPAKTQGQNAYGKWWVGKNPSLGAAFHEMIRNGGYPYEQVA